MSDVELRGKQVCIGLHRGPPSTILFFHTPPESGDGVALGGMVKNG
jgi:hypothetical protein